MVYRDICYKALSFENNIVYGYYYYNKVIDKHYIITDDNKQYEVNSGTVCQYIGLETLNEKDRLFEGDVLLIKGTKWLIEPIGSEERDGNQYGLCASPRGNGDNYFIDNSILEGRIIGNIFTDGDDILDPII